MLKNIIAVIIILSLKLTDLKCQNVSKSCDSLLTMITQEPSKWEFYDSKRKIPKAVLNKIKNETGESFKIANPNRKFQKTDKVVIPFLKTRQLLFVAKQSDNIFLIVYHKGGRGLHTIALLCQINSNSVAICNIRAGYYKNYTELMERVKNGQYLFGETY